MWLIYDVHVLSYRDVSWIWWFWFHETKFGCYRLWKKNLLISSWFTVAVIKRHLKLLTISQFCALLMDFKCLLRFLHLSMTYNYIRSINIISDSAQHTKVTHSKRSFHHKTLGNVVWWTHVGQSFWKWMKKCSVILIQHQKTMISHIQRVEMNSWIWTPVPALYTNACMQLDTCEGYFLYLGMTAIYYFIISLQPLINWQL